MAYVNLCVTCQCVMSSTRIQATCDSCSMARVSKNVPDVPSYKAKIFTPPSSRSRSGYITGRLASASSPSMPSAPESSAINNMNEQLRDIKSTIDDIKVGIKKRRVKKPEEQLNLYEISVDPISEVLYFVMILAKDESSAVDTAFRVLALPNGRSDLQWKVNHIKGPFNDGSVLSVKTIPVK